MPNQHVSYWTPSAIETAKRVLSTCVSVREAALVLAAHLGREVTAKSIQCAFQRFGLPPPSTFLTSPVVNESPLPESFPHPAPIPIRSSGSGPSSERTYLVCSDVHVPGHSLPVMDAFVAIGKAVQAHGVVVAGDFLDLAEVSRHSAGSVAHLEGRRVADSFADGRAMLRHIVHEIDCTDNYFVDGNHEDRLNRWLRSGDNAVWLGTDAMAIDKALELRDLGFRYREGWPEAHVALGHLIITHGRYTNKYHAAKHLDTWRCAVMYGHTHRPQLAYAPGFKSQQVAIGLGHCADITHSSMDYAPTPNDWANGFGLVSVRPSGVFHAEQINFYDGVASFGGRLYGKGGELFGRAA